MPPRSAVDLILTAPSVYRRLAPSRLRADIPESTRRALGVVMRGILHQRAYPQMVTNRDALKQVYESPLARTLLEVRRLELELYTTMLATRAAGYAAPVLRLPPAINQAGLGFVDLARCSLGCAPRKRYKLSRLANRVGAAFRSALDKAYLNMIDGLPPQAAVKLLTDAPLELLPVRDLPLGLRAVCTRLPVTPGNLFGWLALCSRPLLLETTDLSRVLIVNAFATNDPIRGLLRRAVEQFMAIASRKLDIVWADVGDVDSFCDALNSFDGKILLFDGHGTYARNLDYGTLQLGNQAIDVWSLKGRVQVPPIVILSACETHPAGESHATAASGFLMLGARAVLASLVPLDARHAAILAGRLMYRLAEYVPMVSRTQRFPVRWRVMSRPPLKVDGDRC